MKLAFDQSSSYKQKRSKTKKRRFSPKHLRVGLFVFSCILLYKISSYLLGGVSKQNSKISCAPTDEECLSNSRVQIFHTSSILSRNIHSISGGLVGCPCCGWTGPQELFENRVCPICASHDAERLACYVMDTSETVQNSFRKSVRPNIIQIDTHPHISQQIFKRAELVLLDTSYIEPGGKFESYGAQIDLPSSHYDGVVSTHVVEHTDRDTHLLREYIRLLKSRAWLIVEVSCLPSDLLNTTKECIYMNPEERRQCSGQHNHFRLYVCEEFEYLLENVGFDCKRNAVSTLTQKTFMINKSINRQWLCKKKRFAEIGIG